MKTFCATPRNCRPGEATGFHATAEDIGARLPRLRGHGVGRALVDAAEARLLERGCRLIEVTSNQKLAGAHGFYQCLGNERTSHRFAKQVGELTAAGYD